MIGDFQASLYDLFGYLLPGFTATVAGILFLDLWVTSAHGVDVQAVSLGQLWVPFLIVSYLVGHLVHAVGNIVPGLNGSPESLAFSQGGLPTVLLERATTLVHELFAIDMSELPPEEKFAIIDEARVLRTDSGDRDVYVYREGFYRGMTVATALLGLGLAGNLLGGRLCVYASLQAGACMPRGAMLCAVAVVGGSAWAFFYRMRRFGRYRVQRGVYQFIVSSSAKPAPGSAPE